MLYLVNYHMNDIQLMQSIEQQFPKCNIYWAWNGTTVTSQIYCGITTQRHILRKLRDHSSGIPILPSCWCSCGSFLPSNQGIGNLLLGEVQGDTWIRDIKSYIWIYARDVMCCCNATQWNFLSSTFAALPLDVSRTKKLFVS